MSSVAVPSIRYCLRTCANPLRPQRRWARVHDVRFVTTHRDQQQIQDRYREKLQQKAKEQGHESVESLKEAYKEKITELRRTASDLTGEQRQSKPSSSSSTSSSTSGLQQTPPPPPQPTQSTSTTSSSSSSSSQPTNGTPGIKPLSSYVNLSKFAQLPVKEISQLWRLRFASDPKSLCAVIPYETYTRIYTNARNHPQFILPLPRPAADAADPTSTAKSDPSGFGFGAEEARTATAADIHFLQWGFYPPAGEPAAPGSGSRNTHVSTVMFTHLAAFKLHGAYAEPHTTVTHHLDLVDSHGIVLLQGGVVQGKGVSPDEATWLLMCLQKFYDFEGHGGGVGREKRQSLLEKFSSGDAEGFRIEELMDEAERVS